MIVRFPTIGLDVELKAGDLLYIPIGWWHQVRSESFSVMATYTNFLWPNAGHENYPSG
ncbi:MAG: cupin-like domain-containing protein [Sphingobium sp.]|nr:cupin-like domain-containing protein [Sphingobium sp.]